MSSSNAVVKKYRCLYFGIEILIEMRLHRSFTGEESPDNAGHRTSQKEGM